MNGGVERSKTAPAARHAARLALEVGRSGAERHEATCHPRLGGACEAMGLVRVAQAGVAGAALARDGKAGATALARDGQRSR